MQQRWADRLVARTRRAKLAPVSLLPDTGRFEFPVVTANLEWLYRHSSVVIASFGDRQGNRGQVSLTIGIWGAMM